jgi:hypothetical protein
VLRKVTYRLKSHVKPMAGWIWVHAPDEICVIWISIQIMWVRHEGRGAVTTCGQIEGPLGDTLAPAVAPVAMVNCAIVQKCLTELEPVSCHTMHLCFFGILESYGPEIRTRSGQITFRDDVIFGPSVSEISIVNK